MVLSALAEAQVNPASHVCTSAVSFGVRHVQEIWQCNALELNGMEWTLCICMLFCMISQILYIYNYIYILCGFDVNY